LTGPAESTPGATQEKTPAPQKKTEPPPAKPAPAKGSENLIKIGAITLQGGTIDFLDRSINPNYLAHLSEIGGRVSGLSSIDEKPAEVELRGKYNNSMPTEITGKINPLRKDLLLDLKASFKGMDLSTASPLFRQVCGLQHPEGTTVL
jgi:hypothetical protein